MDQNYDLIEIKEEVKIKTILQSLLRKGFITEQEKLTTTGKELLVDLESRVSKKLLKKKETSSEFDEWWKTFPGTDNFVHKGVSFNGCRALRSSKEDCRIKFDKILLEGEYTGKQLIEALKTDVNLKKETSYKTKTNKLSYLQNSLTYLNQRSFEAFITMLTEEQPITKTSTDYGTEI